MVESHKNTAQLSILFKWRRFREEPRAEKPCEISNSASIRRFRATERVESSTKIQQLLFKPSSPPIKTSIYLG